MGMQDPYVMCNALLPDGTTYKVAIRANEIRAVEQAGNNSTLYTTVPNAPIIKIQEEFEGVIKTLTELP